MQRAADVVLATVVAANGSATNGPIRTSREQSCSRVPVQGCRQRHFTTISAVQTLDAWYFVIIFKVLPHMVQSDHGADSQW
jgi:hypothetical protein